jgi:hypothetical protein
VQRRRASLRLARRASACLGALSLAAGTFLLGWLAPPPAALAGTGPLTALAPAPQPAQETSQRALGTTGSARPRTRGGTRAKAAGRQPPAGRAFPGPRMWDPARNRLSTHRSLVRVSQTADLVNQMVHVSWTGFTPSSELLYDPGATDYPVMVAECSGAHPTKWSQCFGASNGGVPGSFSPYGPMNTGYATTSPNGTGQLDLQLLTGQEDQQLGCDVGHPCSLAIVPSQGGNIFVSPVKCGDHSQDTDQSDIGEIAFSSSTGTCSWRDRIIVPLSFAPTPADCPITNASFSAVGSPMLARAMAQWQSALCASSDPESIQYDSALSEPLAREDFLTGTDDVALTTLPASGTGVHPYTYAPLAISSVAIAYWIDNPSTGQPLTHLKLAPRLVAKLLTQSYNFDSEACGHGTGPSTGAGCDNAVDGDPVSLFADPEFRALNHHVATVGDGYQVPTVLSGQSDMTQEVTSWIAANPAADGFMKGVFDPWGEHVNTDYLNLPLPANAFNSMDPYPLIAHRYTPVFPLSQVAQYQADNWYPATDWELQLGNYPKLDPETPGNRALFAILDEADAAAYLFPVAAILNHAGKYVTPASASMQAALADMNTAGNHITQDINEQGKAAGAYPLTMVIYAMVPTGGISAAKAARIAQFLDFVAGAGQTPGNSPGQLPAGYLPLPASLRAQTLAAASAVLSQSGDKHRAPRQHPAAAATPSATPAPSRAPVPAASSGSQVTLGFVTNPATSGIARFAVPVLLITGGLFALAGSVALVAGRAGTTVAAQLRKLGLRNLRLPPGTKK